MAVVEFLYPGAGNLYGESGNNAYLRARLQDALFVTDTMGNEPWFVQNTPNMILMGSMTEQAQEASVRLLTPYKDRLFELIEGGCVVIATGNAWEIFTQEIWFKNDDRHVPCLGLLPLTTQTDYFARNHGKVLGKYRDLNIVGYHARFSQVFGDVSQMAFIDVLKGEGMNKDSAVDGVRYKNFFGTHLLGPMLPTNPDLTEYLLKLADIHEAAPQPLLSAAMDAKQRRLEEFSKPGMKY